MISYKTFKQNLTEGTAGVDSVTLSIPLIIRCLEWAHEEAKDDVEIHKFVENMLKNATSRLDTDDYNKFLPEEANINEAKMKQSPVPGLEYGDEVLIDPEAVELKTKRFEHMVGKIVGFRHNGLRWRVSIVTDNGFKHTFNDVDVWRNKKKK